ncbi:MAG: hypothetical protein V3R81_06810 [Gammaproteobacteria bacterium]
MADLTEAMVIPIRTDDLVAEILKNMTFHCQARARAARKVIRFATPGK